MISHFSFFFRLLRITRNFVFLSQLILLLHIDTFGRCCNIYSFTQHLLHNLLQNFNWIQSSLFAVFQWHGSGRWQLEGRVPPKSRPSRRVISIKREYCNRNLKWSRCFWCFPDFFFLSECGLLSTECFLCKFALSHYIRRSMIYCRLELFVVYGSSSVGIEPRTLGFYFILFLQFVSPVP